MDVNEKKIMNRLKRAEGQLRGIQKMIEEESECIDIVTQLAAVRSSINRTMGLVIGQKILTILDQPDLSTKEQEEKLLEAVDMIVKK